MFANDLYYDKYGFNSSQAGLIISANFMTTAVYSVVIGKYIDRFGHRATLLVISSVLCIPALLFYIIVPTCNQCLSTVIPQIILGLVGAFNSSTAWPSLPLVLEKKYLGTGYGLFFVLQNLFIVALPPIAASTKQAANAKGAVDGYFWMVILFLVIGCIAVMESIALWIQDRNHRRVLDLTIQRGNVMGEGEVISSKRGEMGEGNTSKQKFTQMVDL